MRFEGINCDLLTAKKGRDFRVVPPVHGLGMNVTLLLIARGRLDRCFGRGGMEDIILFSNIASQDIDTTRVCETPRHAFRLVGLTKRSTLKIGQQSPHQAESSLNPQYSYPAVTVVVTVTVICPAKAAVTGMTVKGSGVELGVANAGGEVESALPLSLCEWW